MAWLPVAAHIESEYGSGMSVSFDLESNAVSGLYRVPLVQGSFGKLYGFLKGYGESSLTGRLLQGEGATHIVGEWKHSPGPLTSGTFDVAWDELSQSMKGWWADESGARHDWAWRSSRRRGLRRSAREFVRSNRMTQYLIACCWVFFWQTFTQTGLTILPSLTAVFNTQAMLLFNIVYSMCYISFLASYVVMHPKPPAAYVIGVLLYTLGYMTFAAFFGIHAAGRSWATSELYLQGSLFFLVGSVFLVASTAPPLNMTWCPHKKDNSLFWGCACFLVGSVFFIVDSSRFIAGEESSLLLVALGYCFFTPGRLFVLWSVTTPEVGFSMRVREYPTSPPPTPSTSAVLPCASPRTHARRRWGRVGRSSPAASSPLDRRFAAAPWTTAASAPRAPTHRAALGGQTEPCVCRRPSTDSLLPTTVAWSCYGRQLELVK